jgi:hypothetical protein
VDLRAPSGAATFTRVAPGRAAREPIHLENVRYISRDSDVIPPGLGGQRAIGGPSSVVPAGGGGGGGLISESVSAVPPTPPGKRRLWPIALGIGALGLAGILAARQKDEAPAPTEPFYWQKYPRWIERDGEERSWYEGLSPATLVDAEAKAAVKAEATKYRLQQLGFDPTDPLEIKRFQYSAGIKEDGIIGEQTAAAARYVQKQIEDQDIKFGEAENLPTPAAVAPF